MSVCPGIHRRVMLMPWATIFNYISRAMGSDNFSNSSGEFPYCLVFGIIIFQGIEDSLGIREDDDAVLLLSKRVKVSERRLCVSSIVLASAS